MNNKEFSTLLWVAALALLFSGCSEENSSKEIVNTEEMILIPAGPFIIGSNKTDTQGKAKEYGFLQALYVDEHPRRTVNLDSFLIDKYEVTNGEFIVFYQATQGNVANSFIEKQKQEISQWSQLPVNQVTWFQAQAYCEWKKKRLPTELEWEKAARGPDGLEYPWGNSWNAENLNEGSGEWESGLAPVGSFSQGKSFYGVHDMSGNVAEWIADWYQMYPGNKYKSQFSGTSHKVVRGGGWGGIGHYVIPALFRASHRDYEKPDRIFIDIGFRCANNVD